MRQSLDDTAVLMLRRRAPKFAEWLLHRVWNDREIKGGLLQLVVGVWMIWFAGDYRAFAILLPSSWYAVASIVAGVARLLCASMKRKRLASFSVFFACGIWSVGIINVVSRGEPWRIIIVFFAYQTYETIMSFVRLSAVALRQEEASE